jgi:hypothetical protein
MHRDAAPPRAPLLEQRMIRALADEPPEAALGPGHTPPLEREQQRQAGEPPQPARVREDHVGPTLTAGGGTP